MTGAVNGEPAQSPAALADALAGTGYLADSGLATAGWLALRMDRPLFLEGEAGVGKTGFAVALAEATGLPMIRLQCYEGLDVGQALYDWDFPRQILHLRTLEAVGAERDPARVEASLYDRRFLIARPLLRALESAPCLLLIDEVDRADDEFEAYLLELLADWAVSIPELGRVAAAQPPVVVVTSNRTREVHDALKRRCLYHWVEHPDPDREVAILRVRLPEVSARLAGQVAAATARLRELELAKAPGVAEAIDWARALHLLGVEQITAAAAEQTLGTVVKLHEDTGRVLAHGLPGLLAPVDRGNSSRS
ncbi:MAG: AAA domain-containing protein [Micromonosporaceae bacterium]|nr:AAA domain-containing protein [Micromonosporaceae bacterium]